VTPVDGPRREVLPVDMPYGGASRDPNWKKDRYCDCEVLFDRIRARPGFRPTRWCRRGARSRCALHARLWRDL